jgi:alpha-1,2-mannosyltransferase
MTRRSRMWSWVAGVFALLVLATTIGLIWAAFWAGPKPYYFFDIDFYRQAVLMVMRGTKTMYEAMAYPPFAYLLLWWLPSVPMVLGDQIWTAVTFAVIVVVAVVLAMRAMEARGQDWRTNRWGLVTRACLSAALLTISMPVASQLTCGQLSLLVLALAFLDVAGVVPRRFQGVLVGLAAAIKITPMIFAVYYLVTGQRRQAAVALGSFGAFTAFGALFFPQATLEFWTRLTGTGQEVDPTLVFNLGIRSFLARISLDLIHTSWLWEGLGLVLMIATLWRARRLHRRGDVMEAVLIVGAAAIVVPPNALPHYFIWLPMAAIWLVLTGSKWAKALGVGIYLVYSMAYMWVVLPFIWDLPWLLNTWLAILVLIPVLLGVFGLPKRPAPRVAEIPDQS